MKKLSIILLTFFLTIVNFAANAQITFRVNETCATPRRDIDVRTGESQVVVTYEFPEMTEVKDPETGQFLYHQIPGFGQCADPGKPKLPMRVDTYPVPKGYKAKIHVTTSSGETIENCNYIGVNELQKEGESQKSSLYATITPYTGLFPVSTVQLGDTFTLQGDTYTDIAVCPIQYDYESKTAKIYKRIVYSITFERANSQNRISSDSIIIGEVKPFIDNLKFRGDLRAYDPTKYLDSVGYLIVTTDSIRNKIAKFIEWKKTVGFNVYVLSQEKWIDANKIKEAIIEMRGQHKNIHYLLLIGNYIDVPSTVIKNEPGHEYPFYLSDSKYGTMDDDDFIPDIYWKDSCKHQYG